MDYHKKYLKYKAKYLQLKKIQQTGGRNFTREEYQEYINKPDTASAEAFAKQIAKEFGPDLGSAIQNPFAERDSSLPTSVPSVPSPSAPLVPASSVPKVINRHIYSPVYLSNRLRPGDRVMKVQYTSDVLSGMLGDKGTVHSVDSISNTVAVQFDRYYSQRLLSYVPSHVLEVIYDPAPYSYPSRRRPVYDDDDDDDLYEEEERRPRRKASKKKASKKASKKSSKKASKKRSRK